MTDDIVARLRDKRAWDLGNLDEMDEAADEIERLRADLDAYQKERDEEVVRLRAELAVALQDAEDLNVEVEHYANLAIVDLGANPTVSWMERAEAAEAERDELRALLKEAREELDALGHVESVPLVARIDAALKGDGDE